MRVKPHDSPKQTDVTLADVVAARDFLRAHLEPSPLVRREGVCSALGLDVWLKCESLLPTGAFKVRGGLNLVGRDPSARAGVTGASTGNHGQSLAHAGKTFGVPVTIFVPHGANPQKVAAMRANGASIVEHGSDFEDARLECERQASSLGLRYVHSGNEPYLIAGVATAALEVLRDQLPDADVLIVPVGGGSGAAGAAVVAKAMRPGIEVIGVQAAGAPAAYLTWKERSPRETTRIDTFADGLATRTSFALPQRIFAELLDDFVLVTDEELYAAMCLLVVEGHVVAEGAGAAATAAALRLTTSLTGKTVVCWVTGGNATEQSLRRALEVA